ncbi:PAP2 superfamily protein [Phycisphaerae bacterium RAS2]|nr:PAP2 superfamily protein [Phycisphaerae bacterium RAS2]
MSRITLSISCATVLLASLAGCSERSASIAPQGLAGRLDRIERARLASADDLPPADRDLAWRSSGSGRAPKVRLNQPVSIVASTANGATGAAGQDRVVTLAQAAQLDFDETILLLGDAGEGAGTADGAEVNWSEKEDKYLRRPPLPSFWETVKRDVKNAPADLWRDTKRVYANPVNLVILGGTLGGAIAIKESGVDYSIERHFNKEGDWRPAHHHFKEDWRDAFGAIGNPGTHFALAGAWYLIGQQRMDDKTYEVGKTLFSALAINGVTVMLGQAASYDRAPNGERGTLPSGHTSSSFVVASVMHEAYGHAVGIPLYALAALAGYERIEDGEHYFSDVVMGAVLGTVVGHSVASGRDPDFFGWKIAPYASTQGGTGIAFVKSFD